MVLAIAFMCLKVDNGNTSATDQPAVLVPVHIFIHLSSRHAKDIAFARENLLSLLKMSCGGFSVFEMPLGLFPNCPVNDLSRWFICRLGMSPNLVEWEEKLSCNDYEGDELRFWRTM